MRKLTLAIATLAAALIGSSDVFAQGKFGPDSAECVKYLSYYKEYYKQKAYEEATPNWRKAYAICPATASQNMLIEGAVLMRQLIAKNQNNPEYKNALVDTLLTLHDTRAQYYPKYAVTARNNKGIDLANYVRNDFQKQNLGMCSTIARSFQTSTESSTTTPNRSNPGNTKLISFEAGKKLLKKLVSLLSGTSSRAITRLPKSWWFGSMLSMTAWAYVRTPF